jgi:hypothetical protein
MPSTNTSPSQKSDPQQGAQITADTLSGLKDKLKELVKVGFIIEMNEYQETHYVPPFSIQKFTTPEKLEINVKDEQWPRTFNLQVIKNEIKMDSQSCTLYERVSAQPQSSN